MPLGRSNNRGVMNGSAMLDDAAVLEIRRLRALPVGERPTLRELAERYYVSQACICMADKGETWRHLKTNRGGGQQQQSETETVRRPGGIGEQDGE